MLILGICSLIWLQSLDLDMTSSIRWHPLPLPTVSELITASHELHWLQLIVNTLLLTVLAAGIAIGLPPLGMMLWPSQLGRSIQSLLWGLLRLIPTPLAALLLLLNCEPSLAVAALALGAHNLGVMGRLLKEALDQQSDSCYQALKASGAGDRVAWLYGSLSAQSPSYLAYAAYRADVMLRETAVVGMVGGAGLGWQLIESLSSFNWAQVYLLIGVYAMLTMFGEVLSDHCRQLWTGSKKKPVMALALQS
jgi:phosphonate transport system permease protein